MIDWDGMAELEDGGALICTNWILPRLFFFSSHVISSANSGRFLFEGALEEVVDMGREMKM